MSNKSKTVKKDCMDGDISCKMSTSKICTETQNGKCPQEKPHVYDNCCYELPFGLDKNKVGEKIRRDTFFEDDDDEIEYQYLQYIVNMSDPSSNDATTKEVLNVMNESVNRRVRMKHLFDEIPTDKWREDQMEYLKKLDENDQYLVKLYTHRGDVALNQFIRSNFSVTDDLYKYVTLYLNDFKDGIVYQLTGKRFYNGVKDIINSRNVPEMGNIIKYLFSMKQFDAGEVYKNKNKLQDIDGKFQKQYVKKIYGNFFIYFYNRLNSIILEAPELDREVVLYRGVSDVSYFKGSIDKIYQNNGILSTTFSSQIAFSFAYPKGYMNRIIVPKGYKCLYISPDYSVYAEREIVLPDKSVFMVTHDFKPVKYGIKRGKKIVVDEFETNEIVLVKNDEFKKIGLSGNRVKYPNVDFQGKKVVYETSDIACYDIKKGDDDEWAFYVKEGDDKGEVYYFSEKYFVHHNKADYGEFHDFINSYNILLSDDLWENILSHYYNLLKMGKNMKIKMFKDDEGVYISMFKRMEKCTELNVNYFITYCFLIEDRNNHFLRKLIETGKRKQINMGQHLQEFKDIVDRTAQTNEKSKIEAKFKMLEEKATKAPSRKRKTPPLQSSSPKSNTVGQWVTKVRK